MSAARAWRCSPSARAALWFAQERARFGEDVFRVDFTSLPTPADDPIYFREAMAYLVVVGMEEGQALLALDVRWPYDRQRLQWVGNNHRYECPASGSKFQKDGTYIEGPATRSMDHFHLTALFADRMPITTPPDGAAIPFISAHEILLDTRHPIYSAPVVAIRELPTGGQG